MLRECALSEVGHWFKPAAALKPQHYFDAQKKGTYNVPFLFAYARKPWVRAFPQQPPVMPQDPDSPATC